MASGGGGKDSGREEPVWRFGKVEEGLGKVLTQGIEIGWPEEGDRRRAKKRRSCCIFQAFVKTLPFSFANLYVPGLSTSAMMYGPSHGGESLWRPLLSCRSLSTKSL